MAGSFTDTGENNILNLIFNAAAWSIPASLYFALSTTTPTDAGGNVTEPSGNSYARVAVVRNTTNFPTTSTGSITNGTTITWPTATGSWGTVTHVVIYDASSNGNAIAWGSLSVSKTITSGDTFSLPSSTGFTMTLD